MQQQAVMKRRREDADATRGAGERTLPGIDAARGEGEGDDAGEGEGAEEAARRAGARPEFQAEGAAEDERGQWWMIVCRRCGRGADEFHAWIDPVAFSIQVVVRCHGEERRREVTLAELREAAKLHQPQRFIDEVLGEAFALEMFEAPPPGDV